MVFNSLNSEWKLSVQWVNGGVVLWLLKVGKVLGMKVQIQFSVGLFLFNDVFVINVLIEGSIDNDCVMLINLGVDIVCGILIGNVQCNVDGSW